MLLAVKNIGGETTEALLLRQIGVSRRMVHARPLLGGPLPSKGRAQSSNLLVVNGALYLIDAGDGIER